MENNKNKVDFNLLGAAKHEVVEVSIGAATIEVKKTIPYEDIYAALEWIVNRVIDSRGFLSQPLKVAFEGFTIVKYFTNLDVDFIDDVVLEKDLFENYDILKSTGTIDKICDIIDADQLALFRSMLNDTLTSILAYQNSARGIVDVLSVDAGANATTLEEALKYVEDERIGKLIDLAQKENT